jgi:outer membrane protein assembly factor BamB
MNPRIVIASLIVLVCTITAIAAPPKGKADTSWPAWRGPLATGVAPKAKPPTEWSEEKNIRWKVEIPGRGHATPIIWGDRVIIQTAVETEKGPKQASIGQPHFANQQPPGEGGRRRRGGGFGRRNREAPKHLFEFRVLSIDRKTGKTIWSTTVREELPHEAGHGDASQASNSPVTDGEHIYAFFGSRGLYCLTMDGGVKWKAEFGQMKTRNEFGEGSSPALYGDTIVVCWDHEGEDFIVALNKKTGKEKWRIPRDESTSWTTPIVIEANGKPQVVTIATNFIRAYDLSTGKEIWRCSGMTANTIPSPMVDGDLLYAISGFRGAAALAIRYESAKDDITDSPAIAWKYDKDTPYVPSAAIYKGRLYFIDNNKPILSCLDAKTGKAAYEKQRLPGIDSIYSSILCAGGHVYVVGRNGTAIVLKDGSKFEIVATNKLDDGFDASPAAVGNELYLRGTKHLYCIAAK